MRKLLNIDYGAIHGTYWMSFGVVYSFASVFLLAKGFNNSQIGFIIAVGNLLAVAIQPFLADFADRTKKISLIGITEVMTVMLIVFTALMFAFKGASMALATIYILTIAWITILQPFFNTLNFKLQESGFYINFGVTRSFGSFTYAILCAVLGSVVEKYGVVVLPISGEIVLVLLLISLIFTKKHFDNAKRINKDKNLIRDNDITKEKINLIDFVKRHKMFFVVNIGVVGVFFSNQILNSFMLQIVTNVGGSSEDMGIVFSVLAFLEIPTLICFDKLRKRFSCQSMLKVASICYTLEIGICHLANSVTVIIMAQFLQLFSFALFMPSMVHFIDEIMSEGEAVKGQSLYVMMTTITTIIGSVIGGIVIDYFGVSTLTLISTIVTAIGAVIMICTVNRVENKRQCLDKLKS